MELYSQEKQVDRQPVAAGRFYTADKETLKKELTALFSDCTKPKEEI